MKIALQDKLHQPYREKLVPGMREIMEAFKHEDGVLGCVLSGRPDNADYIPQI